MGSDPRFQPRVWSIWTVGLVKNMPSIQILAHWWYFASVISEDDAPSNSFVFLEPVE